MPSREYQFHKLLRGECKNEQTPSYQKTVGVDPEDTIYQKETLTGESDHLGDEQAVILVTDRECAHRQF